ncbi:response regulator transcription factor [Pseudomonas fluorescens]|uniref:response regulator transcription factor n=1 Tax=Pseudomonas TaxID=286 RepID=UPI00049AB49B|nr:MULTISPECIES: response regulator transcription factor [Pseudomonas]AOS73466.1 DNA-binding response regulator [Pseudomonas fluorescens]NLT86255.1 response regulator transcription factor [Pseudomonas lactis]PMZ70302.1 transcriptional regulator RcsB [Pseudomonas sp. GW247-3R2A]AIB41608.1 LuxR family transcriptional regulator [Pseudomonas sp. WCS374]MBC3256761.1 response regulator transcription factor [Pseudomonas paralactis]
MKTIRIALLDDHAVVRHGLANTLAAEANFEVVGIYEKSRDLIAGLVTAPADLLLLDFSLNPNELDGVSLIRALRVKFPNCHILILSSHHDPATVGLAMRVGARGFVGKGEDMSQLVKAIRKVAAGAVYLNTDMTYRLAETVTGETRESTSEERDALALAELTSREQEVIRCYLAGMTVSEIAEKFNRSIKTISTQKTSAFRKLGVTSNNELFKLNKIIGTP